MSFSGVMVGLNCFCLVLGYLEILGEASGFNDIVFTQQEGWNSFICVIIIANISCHSYQPSVRLSCLCFESLSCGTPEPTDLEMRKNKAPVTHNSVPKARSVLRFSSIPRKMKKKQLLSTIILPVVMLNAPDTRNSSPTMIVKVVLHCCYCGISLCDHKKGL